MFYDKKLACIANFFLTFGFADYIGAFHFLSEKHWKKAIAEAGLEVIANEKITPFANMLVIKKLCQNTII